MYTVAVEATSGAGTTGGTGTSGSTDNPPHFTSSPKQLTQTGIPLDDVFTATDPDGDPLTFTVITPGGVTVTTLDPTTWATDWTAPAIPTGSAYLDVPFHVVVSDGTLSSTMDYTVRVLPADHPPTVAPITRTTVTAGTVYAYDVGFDDPDLTTDIGDTLTLSLADIDHRGVTIDQNGRLRWDTAGLAVGTTARVAVTVTDALGEAATTAQVTLTVVADTSPPAVAVTAS